MCFASMWCDQSWWNSHFIRLTFSLPRFEFGSAIFIAWGGSLLDVLGGAMLAASCSKKKHLSKYPATTGSRSGAPTCTKEYVWGRHQELDFYFTYYASLDNLLIVTLTSFWIDFYKWHVAPCLQSSQCISFLKDVFWAVVVSHICLFRSF